MNRKRVLMLVVLGVATVVQPVVLYQRIMVDRPFSRAARDFDAAYAARDITGMEAAIAAMQVARCRRLFPPPQDCDAPAPAETRR